MSAKVNIWCILCEHFDSFKVNGTNKYDKKDLTTFIFLPVFFAVLSVMAGLLFTNELISLLVNFGAITTALLLSVLVLVYDQRSKLEEKIEQEKKKENCDEDELTMSDPLLGQRKLLLSQLFSNICYATVISVTLVVSCFLEQISRPLNSGSKGITSNYLHDYIFSPLTVFLIIHVILTLMMIIKRMHVLLTAK